MKANVKNLLLLLCAIIIVLMPFFGWPVYRVWQQRLAGEAKLAESESSRKVLVAQAQAEKEAASLRAEAISIVGKSAKEYPEYRYQEFLGAFSEALKEGTIQQIIYVPTEANIPIMEAGRFNETTNKTP